MRHVIVSKKLKNVLIFSRPGNAYIFVDIGGKKPGTLGKQICRHGRFVGSTISYEGDDVEEFNKICRRWYSSHIRKAGY